MNGEVKPTWVPGAVRRHVSHELHETAISMVEHAKLLLLAHQESAASAYELAIALRTHGKMLEAAAAIERMAEELK